MATLTKVPGELNIKTTRDDFSITITFSISVSAYTFAAYVVPKNGAAPVAMTVSKVGLTEYQVKLSLDDSVLAAMPFDTHFWYLKWTDGSGDVRRVLAGDFQLVEK